MSIQKLPQSTIDLIAAGEVITRPLNVVKELLENSIDANSTIIRTVIEQGGVKSIEIIDNGHGIARADAELLCRPHATSKLSTVDDLNEISTFGFRGEALFSVSAMADLEVRTFNIDCDRTGWSAKYKNGEIVEGPHDKPLQNAGTHLIVNNLFSVVRSRKCALNSTFVEEKKSITELVLRYAIHHRDKITISLKEVGQKGALDLVTVLAPMDIRPCIGAFYGLEMQNNLIEIQAENSYQYSAKAYMAFSYKKATSSLLTSHFILFVNDRLVECNELKREVERLAMEFLSVKNVFLFVISLKVPPCDVDVNVHPAKATVKLHFGAEVIALLVSSLRGKFTEIYGSINNSVPIAQSQSESQKTIKQLMHATTPKSPSANSPKLNQTRLNILVPNLGSPKIGTPGEKYQTVQKRQYDLIHNDSSQQTLEQLHKKAQHSRRDLKLRSIFELRKQVSKEKAKDSIDTIKNSTFVGTFDHDKALIQFETQLYSINLKAFLKEQYYQFYLYDFGNFPPIEILPPGNKIKFMIDTYLDDIRKYEHEHYKTLKFQTSGSVIRELLKHSAMFSDYLNLNLTEDEITTLPCIIPDIVPNLTFLGRFLSNLVNQVEYKVERDCFRKIGRVIAEFYAEPPTNWPDMDVHKAYHDLIDTTLHKAIKNYLIVPDWLLTRENICQISDTRDLYRVFERC